MAEKQNIYCVDCGTVLRGRFCWRCGTVSAAWQEQRSLPPSARSSLEKRSPLWNAGIAATAVVLGLVAFVFPLLAVLFALVYLGVNVWLAMPGGGDRLFGPTVPMEA